MGNTLDNNLVSRQAVEDKLVKLCDRLEEIFANIRMMNVDESVCGLCEYDCPAPFECKGFETDECFKLAYEIRHEWQSTKDLPPVNPQPKTGHWIEKDGFDGDTYYDCSECGESWITIEGTPWDNEFKYCPNCGANMVEPQERSSEE